MINVVTEHGSSFKGLAAYLLHDVDQAESSERVAWTETHGLATDDPERAWRIMTATAKSQAELKAEAGIANTGRKSHKHVMHYVLSWHPEERGELTREEMVSAAKASMTYLGTYEGEKLGKGKTAKRTQHADEHQAVIVCHDEGGDKPMHVHIMVNRVHPEHGVILPDSKDYEKLSAWALDYRRAQGKEDYCPERVKAAAKKAQGIVTSNPRKPRNIYEQEQAIEESDPGSRKRALLEQQARRAKALKAKTEAMKQSQVEAMHRLEERHQSAERAERDNAKKKVRAVTSNIRAKYAPRIGELSDRQAGEIAAFNEARGTTAGHVGNLWKAIKTKQWMNDLRSRPLHAMKHSFALAFDSGMQLRDIEKQHAREHSELRGQRTAEEQDAARGVRTDLGFKLDDLRQQYHQQRNDLLLTQGMEKAKNNAEWDQLKQDRQAAMVEGGRGPKPEPDAEATPPTETLQQSAQPNDPPPGPRLERLRELSRQAKQRQPKDPQPDHDQGMDQD